MCFMRKPPMKPLIYPEKNRVIRKELFWRIAKPRHSTLTGPDRIVTGFRFPLFSEITIPAMQNTIKIANA